MSRMIAREGGVSRRMALRVLAAMGLAAPVLGHGATPTLSPRSVAGPAGTATDPYLKSPQVLWERTLSDEALRTLAALADLILPADDRSPAASALGAHEFIDEWVSAPYEVQRLDRQTLADGLTWLDGTCRTRYGGAFADLDTAQQSAICDEICAPAEAPDERAVGVALFSLVRDLTAAAVWTTEEGMADLQYVGNVPLPKWEPPPAAVLKHLGLADESP
jgi:hypothetical protein